MKWVTRERPKIDRIACPWLIRRFIDPEAEFLYVPPSEVLRVAEAEGPDTAQRGIHRLPLPALLGELGPSAGRDPVVLPAAAALGDLPPRRHVAEIRQQLAARQAKARRQSLGKVVTDLARRGLSAPTPSQGRSGVVVFKLPDDSPPVTTDAVRRLESEVA